MACHFQTAFELCSRLLLGVGKAGMDGRDVFAIAGETIATNIIVQSRLKTFMTACD